MSLADVTSARSSPAPDACPECDTSASVTSDLHKYQVACTCKVGSVSVQYACADEPGPPAPSKTDTPPALPPRPPHNRIVRRNNASSTQQPTGTTTDPSCSRRHRYAWWCVGCGALAAALGGLLAAQHILLRAYTASPQHLETVPAAVPAAMLVLTGICIMSLARRRNRYSYMIKVVGACCLVCALTCVLVTITTTVIHMNKLQTLKFCEFTMLTRTCTCYSMPPDLPQSGDDEGVRCVFEGVNGCGVVHGALYWCLRGVFALSVTAGLVCIFSSMLAYQLLSHERKKMYWEQLELRCRSLYRPPAGQSNNTLGRAPQTTCSCCTQCHPAQPSWDISLQHRFWAPGRIGNLYSPNPGTVRKTSAWSWFPWPRSNSQNSRSCHLGGLPQSGDSAYGFCDSDTPQANPNPSNHGYEERYHATFNRAQTLSNFATRSAGHFVPTQAMSQVGLSQVGLSEVGLGQSVVFGESSGSFDAQTGVWGPPPPYSPQGRSASRHHLHQDPASATLLHHHHIDHRSSMHHDQAHSIQTSHTCRNSQYFTHCQLSDPRINPDARIMQTELIRLNPDLAQINPSLTQINPSLTQINPSLTQINPSLTQINPDLVRINQVYPGNVKELARLQEELARLGSESRFNTLRGHLVAYPTCQRSLGMSLGNLHQDCRGGNDGMAVECMHQKNSCKEQRTESQKQGKENMAFQNEKNSPRRSGQECHRNAESEVYFADVSSCCNVSLKAECCMKPNTNTSALVGTIENHPESTSESETGSFTLTRSQKPQPQAVTSKRRPRQSTDKTTARHHEKLRQELNNSIKMAEHEIQQLSNSMCQRLNEARLGEHLRMAALNDSRLNDSIEGRMSDSRNSDGRMSDARMNDSRMSEVRMNDSRMSDARMNDSRMSDVRMNDSRMSDARMNDSRMSDARMNDSRMSDARLNDSRMSDARMNDSRMSDARMNDSRSSDCRINDSRLSDGRNEPCLNELRMHEYHNNSFSERINLPEERRNSDLNRSDISRPDISRPEIQVSSPKTKNLAQLHLIKNSPKNVGKRQSPQHLKQSSSDSNTSNKDFLQATGLSPLTPNTEVSLLSEDDERQDSFRDGVKKCESEMFEREKNREEIEEKKVGHLHCYSDTNTMDSGWQSGSDKHITD